jgi:hypothetical protein
MTTYGNEKTFITASLATSKYYVYRVYDGAYVTTWSDEVVSVPEFNTDINEGAGSVTIQLARSFDSFGESSDVKLNNKVEIWVVDKERTEGLLLYTGYISGYRPIIDNQEEYVEVTLFSYIAEFSRFMFKDASGNTTLTYNSYDPTDILEDVIDKYRAQGGSINYTASSIARTNTVVSYTFTTNTVLEVINKIIELCPVGWYWRVDPDNTIYLQPKLALPVHTLKLGKEVENVRTNRRVEDLINTVYFVGGGDPSLYRKYLDQTSIDTYGRYELLIVDERVTVVATAQTISQRIISQQKDPEVRTTFIVVDSNGPSNKLGYDIESIKPGETVRLENMTAGLSTIETVQILSIQYSPDSIEVEASSRLPKISKRIEDVSRNLEVSQTINNPTAPS